MALTSKDYEYGESRNAEDIVRAFPSLILLIIALVGVVWLNFNNVPAGSIYLGLFLYGIAVLFLIMFFTKSTDKRYEIPITIDIYTFNVFFILGWLLPIILFGIPKLFGAKSIVTAKYFVPLAFGGASGGLGAQSFAVLSTLADPFWRSFIIVFSAGTIEPFAVGFASVAFGVILGYTIRKLIGKLPQGLDFGKAGNKWFDFGIAMIYSIIFFIVIHKLNSSYILLSMFIAAGIFRFLMNMCLYYINLTLAFLFGFHQANNAIAIGLGETFKGFLSHPAGFLILGFYALIIISFFVNIKKLPEVFKNLWKLIGL